MTIEIALFPPERHGEFTGPLLNAFGLPFDAERAKRVTQLGAIHHRIAALDDGHIVGSAGAYRLSMTTPGRLVPAAGLTMVAVLPTHRRRGILTSMMRRHFEEAHENGMPVSVLWASEGQIYGRFGYGLGSWTGVVSIERAHARFKRPLPQPGRFRFVDEREAVEKFAAVYERVQPHTPGMLVRSPAWWDVRRLYDYDKSAPPLQRVLLEIDGKPEGYAIYRLSNKMVPFGIVQSNLVVTEALGASANATWQVWRYLVDMDLAARIEAPLLSPSHPILHMLDEPRRIHMEIEDGLWVRLVDAEAALNSRSYPAHLSLTFALHDAFCPWNSGVYRVADGRVERSQASPDIKLDASALGALYLGGTTARHLADAGDLDELTPGAVDRATLLFRSPCEPWCPEMF